MSYGRAKADEFDAVTRLEAPYPELAKLQTSNFKPISVSESLSPIYNLPVQTIFSPHRSKLEKQTCARGWTSLLLGLLLAAIGLNARAEVRLPKVFSDHMVLQQQKPIVVWGWAQPGETVTVQISTQRQKVQANQAGEWKAVLPSLAAGGPYTLTVSGSNTLRYEDVLVGEVWLCSGQSNMEMGIGAAQNGPQEIAAAIIQYPPAQSAKRWSPEPQSDFDGAWKVCSPQTVGDGGWNGFSAAGYYFGRELYRKLQVPIGLIDATWGGTRIESWTPPEGFAAVPALREENDRLQIRDPRNERHQAKLKQVLKNTEQWLEAARNACARENRPADAHVSRGIAPAP